MDDVDRFLERHRIQLLRYLNGAAPGAPTEPGPLQYVEAVLEEWAKLPRRSRRSPIRPGERTFWYALYTMEELVEDLPASMRGTQHGSAGQIAIHPRMRAYEGLLMRQLVQLRRLLESRAELPDGQFASRPGEW